MPDCLVSFGSNLGDREATIHEAMSLLETKTQANAYVASTLIETAPIGGVKRQAPFLNGMVRLECDHSAENLHKTLRLIEKQLGRERHERWSARTLDLDLIGYGDQVIKQTGLRVPHPRMSFRRFVLEPACELAADWVHPELGVTLAELLETLTSGQNVVQIIGAIGPLVAVELGLMGLSAELGEHKSYGDIGPDRVSRPKLLIDGSPTRSLGPLSGGPCLALADCPTESWRIEVRAALECVWPMCDNARP